MKRRKHIAEQFEIRWDAAEPFALEVQEAKEHRRCSGCGQVRPVFRLDGQDCGGCEECCRDKARRESAERQASFQYGGDMVDAF